MGIQGLLPFLKKIHTPVNIAQFKGCTVAIDAYCWLHKGAFSCAEKLALGEKTDQYVYYCMKYLDYMLKNNVKPIMVFDGCHLKSKADVEKTRRERRELHRKKAAQFLREGRRAEAKECLQRCIDITPQMALDLMNVCREQGVDCIVAPYEADAQLAFLNLAGIAQVIVTEDSDLLLFGCDKIIFKLDFFGNGTLIEKSRLNEVMDAQGGFYTFDKFRYMCILSGCDYLPSLHGIGLVKANKVFRIARQDDIRLVLKKLPTYLKMNLLVSDDYVEGFIRANNTFLYQLCFNPLARQLCPLNPYPPGLKVEEMDYAGQYLPPSKAYQIALGNIDIHDHKQIADFDPDNFVPKYPLKVKHRYQLSIWDKNYKIQSGSPCKELQKNSIETNKPSLHNKEVTVKVKLLKKIPQKRVRDLPSEGPTKSELMALYEGENDNGNDDDDGGDDDDDDDDDDNDIINEPEVKKVRKNLLDSLGEVSKENMAHERKSFSQDQQDETEEPTPLVNESGSDSHLENDCHDSTPGKRGQKRQIKKSSAAIIGENAFKEDGKQGETRKVTPRKERNMFAVPAGSTKSQKFDLNACAMQVKSRYFTGSTRTRSPGPSSQGKKSKASASSTSSIRLMFEKLNQKTVKEEEETIEKEPVISTSPSETSTRTKSIEKGPTSIKDIFEKLKTSKGSNPTLQVEREGKIDVTDNNVSTFNRFSSSFSKKKSSPVSAFSWSRFKLDKESQSPSWSAPRQKTGASENSETTVTDWAAKSSSSEDRNSPHFMSQASGARDISTSSSSVHKFFSQNPLRKVSSPTCGSSVSSPRGNKEDNLNSSDMFVMESQSYRDFLSTMSASKCISTKDEDNDDEQVTDSQTSLAPEDSASQQIVEDGSQVLSDEERQGSQEEEDAEISVAMDSQRSFLGSIDSFCLQGSQDYIDLTDIECDSQKSSLSTASRSSTLSGQSNCRVSGLSRSKKSKFRSRCSSNETGQQNIKDLFSKFVFRKEKSKPDQDEDVSQMTPVVKKMNSSDAGTIQRKIQI